MIKFPLSQFSFNVVMLIILDVLFSNIADVAVVNDHKFDDIDADVHVLFTICI